MIFNYPVLTATLHTWRPSPTSTRGRAMPWWLGPTNIHYAAFSW